MKQQALIIRLPHHSLKPIQHTSAIVTQSLIKMFSSAFEEHGINVYIVEDTLLYEK